ncbi:hypothetical protein C0J52_15922 [Blattella germanica]|nr:hypothetical protein C0J52_15922 [Blattella germanica]
MKLLILLALLALARSETSTPAVTSTTMTTMDQQTTTSATTDTSPKSEKEKRTLSGEASPQNLEYSFSDEDTPTRYVTQQYLQLPATKTQQYIQIPASKAQQYSQYTQVSDSKAQQYVIPQTKAQQYVVPQGKGQQYVLSENKDQQYVQAPATKTQQVTYVPQKQVTDTKKQPPTTYTIQYVPAQHISHSVGYLPKYQPVSQPLKQSTKYQFVSKNQQQSTKASAAAQNLVVPQQYIIPAYAGYHGNNLAAAPQYSAPATTYLQSVPTYSPGHHVFSPGAYPTQAYVVPVHQHDGPQYQHQQQYTLQPQVMVFTLPGGHYLNSHAGQNALLAFLSGRGTLPVASSSGTRVESARISGGSNAHGGFHGAATTNVPYVIQRQQLTYLFPPLSHTPVAQVVPQVTQRTATYSQQPQNVHQQPSSSNTVAYRVNSPLVQPYQIKG